MQEQKSEVGYNYLFHIALTHMKPKYASDHAHT